MEQQLNEKHNLNLEVGKCCGNCNLVCENCRHRGMEWVGIYDSDNDIVKCPNCGREVVVHRPTPPWTEV